MIRKSSKLTALVIILFICLVGSSLFAAYIVELTKHDAEAVNSAGKIRGSMQKLIKLELSHLENDSLIQEIDHLFYDFNTNQNMLYDNKNQFMKTLSTLQDSWIQIKDLISEYRKNNSPINKQRLMTASEKIWEESQDMVSMAQRVSENKMNYFNLLYFSLFFNLMLVVLIIIVIKRDVRDQLEFLVNHDTLTGIYNRNYFQRAFDYESKRAIRYEENLCLILFDIDFFKKVNDQYGHDVGDRVLKCVSKLIQQNTRATDIFSRVGGEEFAIIVPKANIDHTVYLAEKLRTLVETHEFPSIGRITISIGVAQLEPEDTEDSLFKRADIALYRAKHNGRNRTEASYGELIKI